MSLDTVILLAEVIGIAIVLFVAIRAFLSDPDDRKRARRESGDGDWFDFADGGGGDGGGGGGD